MTTHQDTSTEREKRLAAALWHIKYTAVSLADAQVIALEALASRDEAAQQPQGQAVSDEQIMQMSDAAGITFDDCGEHPPAVREDCCLKSRVTEFARAILALRDKPATSPDGTPNNAI